MIGIIFIAAYLKSGSQAILVGKKTEPFTAWPMNIRP